MWNQRFGDFLGFVVFFSQHFDVKSLFHFKGNVRNCLWCHLIEVSRSRSELTEFDGLFWWFWRLVYAPPLTFQLLWYCSMRYFGLSGHPVCQFRDSHDSSASQQQANETRARVRFSELSRKCLLGNTN
jgi:hypothetical protein